MNVRPPAGYRANVGIVLVNAAGEVFVGRRRDAPDAWQMPQGGIDAGETARAAALRELAEETGTDRAEPVAETQDWLTYDLPRGLARRLWGGRYRGQAQKWVLMRFTGTDGDIDLFRHIPPEFDAWRWVSTSELLASIVAFKRPVYEQVLAAFADDLKCLRGPGRCTDRDG